MFAVDLQPSAYYVDAAETPADGYVFGTVRNTGRVPHSVQDGLSGAGGDRYPIKDPQVWLSRLVNANKTLDDARAFLLENGVVEVGAILRDPKQLPQRARAFWKNARNVGATPFAVQVSALWHAKDKAAARLKLADRARQKDLAGRMARSELIGVLVNGGLKKIGILLYEATDGSLVPYADATTLDEVIDLCILDYCAKPEIVECASCRNRFRRTKGNQVFCSTRCKNLFHVRKYRETVKREA